MTKTGQGQLSSRFDEALVYASRLHATQVRKGRRETPYIAHLLGVASLVLEEGGDEEEAIAALLHDALEDWPADGRTRGDILRRFGGRVERIVVACTDSDPDAGSAEDKAPWRERKERYLAHLPAQPPDTLRVSAADKLYNARAILADYREIGEHAWDRFTVGGAEQMWYYRKLVEAFKASGRAPPRLVAELGRVVARLDREWKAAGDLG
jgi:GTP pyrophosphokinase